jgi:serine/threonine protein kinase
MEYVRGGELYQHLKRCKFFAPERVRLCVALRCSWLVIPLNVLCMYAAEICLALT